MKKGRWLVLLLAVSLLCMACGGCASGGSSKVKVNVEVVVNDVSVFGPVSVEVNGTEENPPTVLQCVKEAFILNQMAYTENEEGIASIGGYAAKTEENVIYYWEYTVNGEAQLREPAGTFSVKDGDSICYIYRTSTLD